MLFDIAAANSYGVINSIWWAGNATDGSGVAKANVTYVDGTTAVLDISTLVLQWCCRREPQHYVYR